LTFSADGKLLAEASPNEESVKLWDVATGKDLDRFPAKLKAAEVAFAPDGKTLAVATEDGFVHLIDVARGEEVRQLSPPKRHRTPFALAFSPDGRLLAVGFWPDNIIAVWCPRDGTLVRQHTWEWEPGANDSARGAGEPEKKPGTDSLAFTPDGRSLIAACRDLRVRVWETASGGQRYQIDEHVRCLTATPTGSLFAGAVREKEVCLWDARACLPARRPAKLPDADKVWSGLAAADAAAAYALIRDLAAAPREAVAALDKRLSSATPVEAAAIKRLVGGLDDDSFEAREEAGRRLSGLGEAARAALSDALANKPSAEARRRIEELLGALDGPLGRERVRLVRAVEVLESSGTPEARRVLKRLAGGEPNALLTREAKAALVRLDPN
jgi:hypothetical protein